ncbi:AAA family ATPase [Propioniciclava sinopodophylli]|jgi:ATP-dependent Clp protease ATP-binding subunit ClpA|uniref:AAA family ATPase n=1 Tax=Propioniciclava sinopodophylli TaxID=1837344 RepID=UPI002491D5FE|nr:AAA family ATPase [Propioniciclava sinopodophylli]
MGDSTQVTLFFGPQVWFDAELGRKKRTYLIDAVNELDEFRRRITHRHVVPGQDSPEVDEELPARAIRLVAKSGDYASLQEHAVTNFVGLIQTMSPKHLWLHNPPATIQAQLERAFNVKARTYEYPVVAQATLRAFRDQFGQHVIGQERVGRRVLAALYGLTTPDRLKPVVLMFYGPSGVGKTETAQFVNGLLGGQLFRKQFSMFQNDKFASYLFGGTHAEPSFAHDLVDRASGVILIDEFDKANSIFHSAFYEMFDEGIFEDKNYRVRLGPAIVICTSNYGSEGEIEQALGEALTSRFDALIQFDALTDQDLKAILDRLITSRYSKLTPADQVMIDINDIHAKLLARAGRVGNVRKLGKLVDETLALALVDRALASAD